MFNFFRNRGNIHLPFIIDMHSHLLPGVDDGSPDVETSLSLIRSLTDIGFKKFITTPHIYSELYPNSPKTLQPAYEILQAAMAKEGMDIPIRYAAEYFLDDHVDHLLKEGEPLLTIQENKILVETSFVQPPLDLDRRLFDLQVAGYQVILAHPERYPYWHIDKQKYHELRERGILLQVNLLSLTGYYGKPIAEVARYLVKEELVDLVGTDCHHDRHASTLLKEVSTINKLLDPLLRKDKLLNPLLQ
jgi:protein-tyrosine phosphatase